MHSKVDTSFLSTMIYSDFEKTSSSIYDIGPVCDYMGHVIKHTHTCIRLRQDPGSYDKTEYTIELDFLF